jgi:hypothetical protein
MYCTPDRSFQRDHKLHAQSNDNDLLMGTREREKVVIR